MRIIHVNLARGFRGGERQTVLLIRALEKLGVDQVLVCRNGTPMVEELLGSNCLIHCVKRPLGSVFFASNLLSQSDVLVHAHEARASQWAYVFYLITKTPYLITRRIQKRPSNRWLTKLVYKTAESVISISSSVSTTMTSYLTSISTKQVTSLVIPDASAELPVTVRSNILRQQYPDKFLIGHIGALSIAEKGQDLIIAAAKMLEIKYPKIQFVLIGDGKDRQSLETMAGDLNNLSFLGFRTDIGDLLAGLDTFIFPSRHEGLGSSLLDALSFNIPVIASDIPGITDIIYHKVNGLLTTPDDAIALTEAIEELYINDDLRSSIILNTEQSLHSFKPSVVASQYLELYKAKLAC